MEWSIEIQLLISYNGHHRWFYQLFKPNQVNRWYGKNEKITTLKKPAKLEVVERGLFNYFSHPLTAEEIE